VVVYSLIGWGLAMAIGVFAYVAISGFSIDPALIALLQVPVAGIVAAIHKSINWKSAGVEPPPIVTPQGANLTAVMDGVATIEGG